MEKNAKDRIIEIRNMSGLSQEQFAEKYAIQTSSIERWENGSEDCPEYVIELLRRAVEADFKTGKWIKHHHQDKGICMTELIECSICGKCICDRYNPYKSFCPSCGSKMLLE